MEIGSCSAKSGVSGLVCGLSRLMDAASAEIFPRAPESVHALMKHSADFFRAAASAFPRVLKNGACGMAIAAILACGIEARALCADDPKPPVVRALSANPKSPALTHALASGMADWLDFDIGQEMTAAVREAAAAADDELRDHCAAFLRRRISPLTDIPEELLDHVDFGLFADEGLAALSPFRLRIGGESRVLLPADIGKIAGFRADPAEAFSFAASLRGLGKIRPASGRGPHWDRAKSEVRKLFAAARKRAGARLALAAIEALALNAKAGDVFVAPEGLDLQRLADRWQSGIRPDYVREAALSELDELGSHFAKKAGSGMADLNFRDRLEEIFNDADFLALAKSDPLISGLIGKADSLSGSEEEKRLLLLEEVQRFWRDACEYAEDSELYGRDEYWAKPSETWRNRAGDCEDLAFAKYATLRLCGVPAHEMHFLDGFAAKDLGGHLSLAVRCGSTFKVLDVLHDPKPIESYPEQFLLESSFNENGHTWYQSIFPMPPSGDGAANAKPGPKI